MHESLGMRFGNEVTTGGWQLPDCQRLLYSCSVEPTPSGVIGWAASTSASKDMGELYLEL